MLFKWLKKRQAKGDQVILWTCRENYGGLRFVDAEYKNEAVRFCTRHRLFFANVNKNIGEVYGDLELERNRFGRKITATVYIDDRSLPFDPDGFLAGLWWRLYLWRMEKKLK